MELPQATGRAGLRAILSRIDNFASRMGSSLYGATPFIRKADSLGLTEREGERVAISDERLIQNENSGTPLDFEKRGLMKQVRTGGQAGKGATPNHPNPEPNRKSKARGIRTLVSWYLFGIILQTLVLQVRGMDQLNTLSILDMYRHHNSAGRSTVKPFSLNTQKVFPCPDCQKSDAVVNITYNCTPENFKYDWSKASRWCIMCSRQYEQEQRFPGNQHRSPVNECREFYVCINRGTDCVKFKHGMCQNHANAGAKEDRRKGGSTRNDEPIYFPVPCVVQGNPDNGDANPANNANDSNGGGCCDDTDDCDIDCDCSDC